MKITEKLGAEFILPLFNNKHSKLLEVQYKSFVEKVICSAKSLIQKKITNQSFPPELIEYLFLGKNSRSKLIFLIGKRYNVPEDFLIRTSCVVELLHEASLIHDDLQDRQICRRNRPTIWREFSESTAISWGDFLLSLALEPLLQKNICPDDIKNFNFTVQQMLEGQNLEQINKTKIVKESDYYKVIDLKTSSLLRLPMLLLSDYLKEDKHQLLGLATNLGKAYQIHNDNC